MEQAAKVNDKQETLFDLQEEIKKDKKALVRKRGVPTDPELAMLDNEQQKAMEEFDVPKVQKIIERRMTRLKQYRMACIKMTEAEDWVIYVETDKDGNKKELGYCQAVGCCRANKFMGAMIENVREQPREDFDDGTFTYSFIVDGYCTATGEEAYDVLGGRWSGSRFFDRQKTPDPMNIKKSARENADGRCFRKLLGIGRIPKKVLEDCGLDTKKMAVVEFKKGDEATASDAQYKMIHEMAAEKIIDFNLDIAKDATPKDLTKPQASELITRLMKIKSQEKDAEAYLKTIDEIKAKVKGWDDVTEKPEKKGNKK